jgi:tetratricopeptide (TPR) repeat protein
LRYGEIVERPASSLRQVVEAGDEASTEGLFRTGDFAEAGELLRTARAEASGAGDRHVEAAALDRLGMLLHYQNIMKLRAGVEVAGSDVDEEEELFREALAIRESLGDAAGMAQSLFGVGLVRQVLHSDWAAAMPYFRQALDFADTPGNAVDLYTRSEINRHIGFYFAVEDLRPEEAARHLEISLQLREELGDSRRIPSGLVALGEAELAAGNRERAIELLSRAVSLTRSAGLLPERLEEAEQALREAEVAPA